MNKPQKYTSQKIVTTFVLIALLLSALSITVSPALGDDDETDFLIPGNGYTIDYYKVYGEPTIEASVTGDPEFARGEVADLQVKLVNKGIIEGLKRLYARQSLILASREELIALAEMSEEKSCTTAKGIEANLISESDYIHVEPTTSLQTADELETGHTQALKFTIRIDDSILAGDYEQYVW